MDAREQRGLAIAALCKIDRQNGLWFVPSQSSPGKYTVRRGADGSMNGGRCTCPDFEDRQLPCKHIYAVEFTMKREVGTDGAETITRSTTITERVTYKQNWPAYNDAQKHEKDRFQILLNDLCSGIVEPERCQLMRPHRGPHGRRELVAVLPRPDRHAASGQHREFGQVAG